MNFSQGGDFLLGPFAGRKGLRDVRGREPSDLLGRRDVAAGVRDSDLHLADIGVANSSLAGVITGVITEVWSGSKPPFAPLAEPAEDGGPPVDEPAVESASDATE